MDNSFLDGFSEKEWQQVNAMFSEHARWASLSVSIKEISVANKKLVRNMVKFSANTAIPLLASLLTLPKLQSNCIRLEVLLALAVVHCHGSKKANIKCTSQWFYSIGKSMAVLGEDTAEDEFVALVHDSHGDYRIIEGVWEAAGFYTQRVLDVVATMPNTGNFARIKKSVRALLKVSDIVCEKSDLVRYQLGSDERLSTLQRSLLPSGNALASRVSIPLKELDASGVAYEDLMPFLLRSELQSELLEQQVGLSYLDRYPLIQFKPQTITVAVPTALSVAIRDFVIKSIVESNNTSAFEYSLALGYADLLTNTPLIGGPSDAPIRWQNSDRGRLSVFSYSVDEGYVISFHLFLPPITCHLDGGFKEVIQDDGNLTNAVQQTVNDIVDHYDKQDDFRAGLAIIVGCGWGKGLATRPIELDHPKWRGEFMSVADLVRLSWLSDMKPANFWRIQDGLETIRKAGIHIKNPNGILNLIGWVRSNDGHFVPHAQLPQGRISPTQPLNIVLPINLLREVRADSDRGYDRHSAIDNTGIWHQVQHVSPSPFFASESSKKLYASINDARHRVLTSVYEGDYQLWLSLSTPRVPGSEIGYHLWEMANEWLHRLGAVLDQLFGKTSDASPYKVYVDFLDEEPEYTEEELPSTDTLLSLCAIEPHSEPNSCKAIFYPGFIDGFRFSDNVAERLFTRTLAKAYLNLLGLQDKMSPEEVEQHVVPNNEARSFHLFHAHHYIDYVRHTLPKKLISIDPIDDAAIRIGLAWKVFNQPENDRILGKEACTDFLGKIVDVLLDEISDSLKAFDRRSTLFRLVGNCEKASVEGDHWNRTSAAVLGLHGVTPETIGQYVEQASKFAGAAVATRILIEIGLCVCPSDHGIKPSTIELSKLIAHASLLVRIGGLSDAIYYSALTPELSISPLGDILFRDDLGRLVVDPMLGRVVSDKYVANASHQKKNYKPAATLPEIKGQLEKEFLDTWKIEMGFDVDEARLIVESLEDKGVTEQAAVYTVKKSEYLALVCSEIVIGGIAEQFLKQFSLNTRLDWEKPPNGFRKKDIYPWRFGRRLSYVTRPILILDDREDPALLIAPNALRTSLAYVVDGAWGGRFDQDFFQSKEMRDGWWINATEGHTFNEEVAKTLADAGWQTRENIGLPEVLNRKLEKNYGDIDILAWRNDRPDVLVVECKDLSLARNHSEVAAMLSDYQGGEAKGKPDKLKKHLDRIGLLEENMDQLQIFVGTSSSKLVSCLVCSGVVPMQYAKIDALSNTCVGNIADILAL